MKFSSIYEFKKEQLPLQLYEEIRYLQQYKYVLDQNIEVNQKTNGLSQRDMVDAFKQFLIEELALLVFWILSTIKRGSMHIKSAKFGVDTKKFSPT